MSAKIFLIHGTWGRNSWWISDESTLKDALRELVSSVHDVQAFRWSGKNTFSARLEAANELAKTLSDTADAKLAVCAHSHGGNVLAYALRRRPGLTDRLAGAVFISTPFLIFRIVPSWRLLIDGLLTPLPIIGYLCLSLAIVSLGIVFRVVYTPWIVDRGDPAYLGIALWTFASACALLLGGTYLLTWFNRWRLRLSRKILQRARRTVHELSCELPGTINATFLRVSSDEAAGGLGFFQATLGLMTLVNVLSAYIYRIISAPFRLTRVRHPLRLLAGTAVFSIAVALSVTDVFVNFGATYPQQFADNLQDGYRSLRDSAWAAHAWAYLPAYVFLDILFVVTSLCVTALLAIFVLSLAIFGINWALSFSFGRLPPLLNGIIQVAVETTPPGDWTVRHVTWAGRGRSRRPLLWRHSDSYSEPESVIYIAHWIRNAISRST